MLWREKQPLLFSTMPMIHTAPARGARTDYATRDEVVDSEEVVDVDDDDIMLSSPLYSRGSSRSSRMTHPLLDPITSPEDDYSEHNNINRLNNSSNKCRDRDLPLPPPLSPSTIQYNFHKMSIAFAVNHGCSISVLGLSAARLGSTGIWMSSILYASYTIAALYGASLIVERYCKSSSRTGLMLGMAMCASYVTAFFVMSLLIADEDNDDGSDGSENNESSSSGTMTTMTPEWCLHLQSIVAVGGAIVGGVGSSVLWVSQGMYFARASQLFAVETMKQNNVLHLLEGSRDGDGGVGVEHERRQDGGIIPTVTTTEDVTGKFGGNFAFVFLSFEVVLRLLSTFLIHTAGLSWRVVFGVYSLLSILPVCFMMGVLDLEGGYATNTAAPLRLNEKYGTHDDKTRLAKEELNNEVVENSTVRSSSNKATATLDLLWQDSKARYMAPMCVLFGISTSFCSSVINGEVIQKVLSDPNSTFVGLFTAVTSLVAAAASFVFGRLQSSSSSQSGRSIRCGKGVVLTIGALSYLVIAIQFLAFPGGKHWNRTTLLFLYILLGIGRAAYEGTLRAVFADFFPNNEEGAFGCIILWSGSASTIGYLLSATGALRCETVGTYCLEYTDGSIHNVFFMELAIIVMAAIAIPAFFRANWLFCKHRMTC